ncbi:hypothetical protein ABPG72_021021 [Tetrahymena utriculariae]
MAIKQQLKQTYFQVDYQIQEPEEKQKDFINEYEDKISKFYIELKKHLSDNEPLDQIKDFDHQKIAKNVCFWFLSRKYNKQTDYQHILRHLNFPMKSKEKIIKDLIRYQDVVKSKTNEKIRIVKFDKKGEKDQLILIHFLEISKHTQEILKKFQFSKFKSNKSKVCQRSRIKNSLILQFTHYSDEFYEKHSVKKTKKIIKNKTFNKFNNTQAISFLKEHNNFIKNITKTDTLNHQTCSRLQCLIKKEYQPIQNKLEKLINIQQKDF